MDANLHFRKEIDPFVGHDAPVCVGPVRCASSEQDVLQPRILPAAPEPPESAGPPVKRIKAACNRLEQETLPHDPGFAAYAGALDLGVCVELGPGYDDPPPAAQVADSKTPVLHHPEPLPEAANARRGIIRPTDESHLVDLDKVVKLLVDEMEAGRVAGQLVYSMVLSGGLIVPQDDEAASVVGRRVYRLQNLLYPHGKKWVGTLKDRAGRNIGYRLDANLLGRLARVIWLAESLNAAWANVLLHLFNVAPLLPLKDWQPGRDILQRAALLNVLSSLLSTPHLG